MPTKLTRRIRRMPRIHRHVWHSTSGVYVLPTAITHVCTCTALRAGRSVIRPKRMTRAETELSSKAVAVIFKGIPVQWTDDRF